MEKTQRRGKKKVRVTKLSTGASGGRLTGSVRSRESQTDRSEGRVTYPLRKGYNKCGMGLQVWETPEERRDHRERVHLSNAVTGFRSSGKGFSAR